MVPPLADENGYGLRVPGLLVSPYARRGFVDHQTLTFDAYLKLIEDRFLEGQRLDPSTDERPDARPVVRETLPLFGDLALAFDFDRPPRPPLSSIGRLEEAVAAATRRRSCSGRHPGHRH